MEPFRTQEEVIGIVHNRFEYLATLNEDRVRSFGEELQRECIEPARTRFIEWSSARGRPPGGTAARRPRTASHAAGPAATQSSPNASHHDDVVSQPPPTTGHAADPAATQTSSTGPVVVDAAQQADVNMVDAVDAGQAEPARSVGDPGDATYNDEVGLPPLDESLIPDDPPVGPALPEHRAEDDQDGEAHRDGPAQAGSTASHHTGGTAGLAEVRSETIRESTQRTAEGGGQADEDEEEEEDSSDSDDDQPSADREELTADDEELIRDGTKIATLETRGRKRKAVRNKDHQESTAEMGIDRETAQHFVEDWLGKCEGTLVNLTPTVTPRAVLECVGTACVSHGSTHADTHYCLEITCHILSLEALRNASQWLTDSRDTHFVQEQISQLEMLQQGDSANMSMLPAEVRGMKTESYKTLVRSVFEAQKIDYSVVRANLMRMVSLITVHSTTQAYFKAVGESDELKRSIRERAASLRKAIRGKQKFHNIQHDAMTVLVADTFGEGLSVKQYKAMIRGVKRHQKQGGNLTLLATWSTGILTLIRSLSWPHILQRLNPSSLSVSIRAIQALDEATEHMFTQIHNEGLKRVIDRQPILVRFRLQALPEDDLLDVKDDTPAMSQLLEIDNSTHDLSADSTAMDVDTDDKDEGKQEGEGSRDEPMAE